MPDPTQHQDRCGNGDREREPATEALRDAGQLVREVAEYATHFVNARIDKVKVTARNIGIYAVLGMLGLAVGAAVLVTATVLLLVGLGGAISALFDARPWVGQLIVGLLILGGLGLIVVVGMMYMTRQFRKKTVKKYEQRKQQQRINFGQDVHQRARETGN